MAVRALTAPSGARRSSKFPFTAKEVEQAVELLDKGETPGVGPYEDIKTARSAAQALKRAVTDVSQFEESDLGTKGWENEKGEGLALLRVKS